VTDLLRQGSQWLAAQLGEHAAGPVTYARGEVEVEVPATLGRTQMEVDDGYGLRLAAHATDFLIAAADLAETFGEPEIGDRITVDGDAYEVLDLAGQGAWRWSDPHRTMFRIHTKDVS
jgi:hypothetical protein